jgi:hypothetical protein
LQYNKDIPIEEELVVEAVKGWERKPKGSMHYKSFGGGFIIDPAKKKEDDTIDGKKDAFGK